MSMDFLIAVSLLVASLALFTQYLERTQTRFGEYAEFSSNNAEAIAANLTGEGNLTNPQKYCLSFSNATREYNHGGCACPKNVFTARRLILCEGAKACVMEVRTCD
jgi:CobQ-like glutamine amidotransferase family enzyme